MTKHVTLPGTIRCEDGTLIVDLNPDDILDLILDLSPGEDISVVAVTIGGEPATSFHRA
jgi:hypothetical protein